MEKILIIDDQLQDIHRIKNKVTTFLKDKIAFDLEVSTDSTASKLLEEAYSLYFLDIDMPNQDGISFARQIRKLYPKSIIIFVTSHNELVFHSFEVHPFFFVRKTHFIEDMDKALSLFYKTYQDKHQLFKCIYNNKELCIPLAEIDYFEKYLNYLYIHTQNTVYKVRESISKVETELQEYYFCRIHSNCLVNLKNVNKIEGNQIKIRDTLLEISRRRISYVKNAYLDMLGDVYG